MLRTAKKLIMYHGTCSGPSGSILRSIVKNGLIPDPKKRAYRSPHGDDDDYEYGDYDFDESLRMSLDESLGGAYLTTNPEEAKRYAQNACYTFEGRPVLVSAQIETRTPEVKIDEDFLVNYSWDHIVGYFEAEDEGRYHIELYDWLTNENPPLWNEIARDWVKHQFPGITVHDKRWEKVLPALGEALRNIGIITFLQVYEGEADTEAYAHDEHWEVDPLYEADEALSNYKASIEFVSDAFQELARTPHGEHNIRILRPVGYRGANRILAIISWTTAMGRPGPREYGQVGRVYYARTHADGEALIRASGIRADYSLWTGSDGHVYYDQRAPSEQLRLPNVAKYGARMVREEAAFEGTELHAFDFDNTLFKSPGRPPWWPHRGWWSNAESLQPPCIPEEPSARWWNSEAVRQASKSIEDEGVYTVMITGRLKEAFGTRVTDLLHQQDLVFDELRFKHSVKEKTDRYKARHLKSIASKFPTITTIHIWDDDEDNLATCAAELEDAGYTVKTHLVESEMLEVDCSEAEYEKSRE